MLALEGAHAGARIVRGQVGVSHRCRDVAVSEDLGDGAKWYARLHQPGGAGVAQVVDAQALDTGHPTGGFEGSPDIGESLAVAGEHPRAGRAELGPVPGPAQQRLAGVLVQRHGGVSPPFLAHDF